jgi:hypothetical protein
MIGYRFALPLRLVLGVVKCVTVDEVEAVSQEVSRVVVYVVYAPPLEASVRALERKSLRDMAARASQREKGVHQDREVFEEKLFALADRRFLL